MAILYVSSQVLHPPAELQWFYISVIGSLKRFLTPGVSKGCTLHNLVFCVALLCSKSDEGSHRAKTLWVSSAHPSPLHWASESQDLCTCVNIWRWILCLCVGGCNLQRCEQVEVQVKDAWEKECRKRQRKRDLVRVYNGEQQTPGSGSNWSLGSAEGPASGATGGVIRMQIQQCSSSRVDGQTAKKGVI